MIAIAEPLSKREEEELALFRFEPKLGYARPMRHVWNRWTWEETERYLQKREERRRFDNRFRNPDRIADVLERVNLGLLSAESAQRLIDELWPEPKPGISFVESKERETLGGDD